MSTEPLPTKLRTAPKLLVTAFFRGILRVLHGVFGDRPGAYPMIFLWVALILAAWNTVIDAAQYLVDGGSPFDRGIVPPLTLALPLAIVAVCVHRITTRSNRSNPAAKLILILLGTAGAAAIYWMQTLSGLAQLLGAAVPQEVSGVVFAAWHWLSLVSVLVLLIDCRWTLPISWRLIATGAIGGGVLAILLADPVITWTFGSFVPGGITVGPASRDISNLVSVIIAVLLGLMLAPLAVIWSQPSNRRQRLAFGAFVGAIAGFVLFIMLGGPTAGIIAATPLYGVAQTRVGFNAAEWILKLGQAVSGTLLSSLVAFWLLPLTGGVIGASTVLLTPAKIGAKTHEPGAIAAPVLPMVALVTTIPLMGVTIACITILGVLGPSIERLASQFGFITGWRPGWTTLIASYQPWLVLTLLQSAGLFWVSRYRADSYPRALGIAACMSGLLNLLWFPLGGNALSSAGFSLGWINAALGLETLIVGLRLYRQRGTPNPVGRRVWFVVWMWGLLVAMFFAQALVSGALNLVLIETSMITDLAQTSAPPPGLPWLHEKLSAVYAVQSWSAGFPITAILSGLLVLSYPFVIAGIVALIVFGLPGQTRQHAFRAIWQRLSRIIRAIYQHVTPGTGRVWLRSAIWVAAGLILDTILQAGIFTAIAGFVVVGSLVIERVPIVVVALAFIVTVVGTLCGWMGVWLTSYGTALVVICAFLSLRALATYTPERWRSAARLTAVIGFVLIGAVFAYLSQVPIIVHGGISRYDGQRWQVFTPENSSLGVNVGYRFYADDRRNLWLGSNRGVAVRQEAGKWTPYLIYSTETEDEHDTRWITRNLLLADAGEGKLWVAFDGAFSQYDLASNAELGSSRIVPRRKLTSTEATSPQRYELGKALLCDPTDIESWSAPLLSSTPTPGATVNSETGAAENVFSCSLSAGTVAALAQDKRGGTWLATTGNGVIYLDAGRDVNDSNWQRYSAELGQLASNTVTALTIDPAGVVWVGTDHGLSRFNGATWNNVPGTGDQNIATVLVDSRGGVWTGTSSGAQRFEDGTWTPVIKDVPVTAFAEGQDGSMWIGTTAGLIRYSPQSASQDMFNAQNSGMLADSVRDLYVDKQGGLWVSTFTAEQSARSLAPGILLHLAFLDGLFVFTYRGYRRSPETRMRRLGRQITADPGGLYPAVYQWLNHEPDSSAVLARLPRYLSGKGDRTGAAGVVALATLASDAAVVPPALEATATAFADDSHRQWAASLGRLHRLLATALAAQRVSDVTGLELTVSPGDQVVLSAKNYEANVLADFLPEGMAQTWRSLEKIADVLHKYESVDDPADQLSYLADALAGAEVVQRTAQKVGLPEGPVLVAIVNQWRTIITGEIGFISGRAELNLELRTRQALRAPEVEIVLRVQNTGRSAAENVAVKLVPAEGFTLDPNRETELRLERLPPGHAMPVEFVVRPGTEETARIRCVVTWSDRTGEDRRIDFGDILRFYDVPQAFQRIPNPYIVGHPIRAAAMFYGREDIFQFIAENLVGPVQDRTLVLYGQRRTGKTSILYQLLDGRLGANFIPVLIDMQELAPLAVSMSDFFGEIAYLIGRAARKAGLTVETPDTSASTPTRAFNRFLDVLEDSLGDRRLVLMFDEFELIESKIGDGKLDSSILGYLRSLIQHRRHLVFIFSGTHRLQEMSHDYWSVLFNIALHRQVNFLSPPDATALIRQPVSGFLDVDDLAVEKILRLTGGHAYFVQLLCWALVNQCNAKARNYATINDVSDAVHEMLTTGEAHFVYIWQMANREERVALAGLAHTIRPGKTWAKPAEILETLTGSGDSRSQLPGLVKTLDQLVVQGIVEATREGVLRYRFPLDVLCLWIAENKSVAALMEQADQADK